MPESGELSSKQIQQAEQSPIKLGLRGLVRRVTGSREPTPQELRESQRAQEVRARLETLKSRSEEQSTLRRQIKDEELRTQFKEKDTARLDEIQKLRDELTSITGAAPSSTIDLLAESPQNLRGRWERSAAVEGERIRLESQLAEAKRAKKRVEEDKASENETQSLRDRLANLRETNKNS